MSCDGRRSDVFGTWEGSRMFEGLTWSMRAVGGEIDIWIYLPAAEEHWARVDYSSRSYITCTAGGIARCRIPATTWKVRSADGMGWGWVGLALLSIPRINHRLHISRDIGPTPAQERDSVPRK